MKGGYTKEYRDDLVNIGLDFAYSSTFSRVQNIAGKLGIRYFFWGSHPEGLAQLSGIDMIYEGWRPYMEGYSRLGQFVIKTESQNTRLIASEYFAFGLQFGTYFHVSKETALDLGLGVEYGIGFGTLAFSSLNMTILIGPVFYY